MDATVSKGRTLGSMILLLGPPTAPQHCDACFDLLTVEAPQEENVLFVTFTKSPTELVNDWNVMVGDHPAKMGIVSVGDLTRSAADPVGTRFTRIYGPETIRVGSTNPEDFVDLGISISEYFEECGITRSYSGEHQNVVCFHSLTALLQWVDLQSVFRFLHVLSGVLKDIDAIAHFHLDPEAVDPRELATIRSLFDDVIETPVGRE